MKLKLVKLSPMRIPPQEGAARELIAQMRPPFPVATYLRELIKRNQPRAKQGQAIGPHGPAPVEPALEEMAE